MRYRLGWFAAALFVFCSLWGQAKEEKTPMPPLSRQEVAESIEWYKTAADRGDAKAQFLLGHFYSIGLAVPQSYSEAAKWFRKASEQGNAEAQGSLGSMYGLGQGVPQDFVEAYVWLNLAVANGYAKAAEARDVTAGRLSPQALEQAQARARQIHEEIHARAPKTDRSPM